MDNSLEKIKTMLYEDTYRWQCPTYCGVVVVPEDCLKKTMNFLKEFTVGEKGICLRYNSITFSTGGSLLVRTGDKYQHEFQCDHAGMQYTSILICQGHVTPRDNIDYLLSRARSSSSHDSKVVIM